MRFRSQSLSRKDVIFRDLPPGSDTVGLGYGSMDLSDKLDGMTRSEQQAFLRDVDHTRTTARELERVLRSRGHPIGKREASDSKAVRWAEADNEYHSLSDLSNSPPSSYSRTPPMQAFALGDLDVLPVMIRTGITPSLPSNTNSRRRESDGRSGNSSTRAVRSESPVEGPKRGLFIGAARENARRTSISSPRSSNNSPRASINSP
jgi:hypothetical protein